LTQDKPRLTILLGAGSTMNLYRNEVADGKPSTAEITKHVVNWPLPAAVISSPPIRHSKLVEPFLLPRDVPIFPLLYRALSRDFDQVDFELVLHAIEELEPLVNSSLDRPRTVDRNRPVLSSFVELVHAYDLVSDPALLVRARQIIISEVHKALTSSPIPARQLPIECLLQALADRFRIAVFTLNYDDVADRSFERWFDGFSGEQETSPGGRFWVAQAFDSRTFDGWRNASDPVLIHLHGSVRFGYLTNDPWRLARFSDASAAGQTLNRGPDNYRAGAPIISGLKKLDKLIYNPDPFGYYYRAFIDSMLECNRLLVIGYGGRDDHINTWLEQFSHRHSESARTVWITRLTTHDALSWTPEMNLFQSLARGRYDRYKHAHEDGGTEQLHDCGLLGLIPSGFPFEGQILPSIVRFLSS
jgi:hypothetical protein